MCRILNGCRNLHRIKEIQDLPLETLAISDWPRLRDLAGLNKMGLTRLKALRVQWSHNLLSLYGIQGLPLKELSLRGCSNLVGDLTALKGMELTSLDVGYCRQLKSLKGIEGMKLQRLFLTGCGIADLDGIQSQTFSSLELNECQNLRRLYGLERMPLETLSARWCPQLRDISALRGTKLTELHLDGCTNLTDLNGIQGLPLVRITLTGCEKLKPGSYRLLAQIPNLTVVDTGDKRRDAQILEMCKKLRERTK